MSTNKERIENPEHNVSDIQDHLSRMELSTVDKLHQLENVIRRLINTLVLNRESSSSHQTNQPFPTRIDGSRPVFHSRMAKLDFPTYSGDNPTEWLNRVEQLFNFQHTEEEHKVSFASFYLEDEANQWWPWLKKAYREEGRTVTWTGFMEELWARFGSTKGEDFDEAFSHIKQTGLLQEYQREFERLGNRVHDWTQRAFTGTFMGGLNPEIAYEIGILRSKSLKEAISLAHMREEQLGTTHNSAQLETYLPKCLKP